jgi:hypothetical protein
MATQRSNVPRKASVFRLGSNFKEIAAENALCSAASTGSSALKLNAAPKGWIAILSIVGGQNLTRPLLMHAAAKSRVSAGSSQGGISTTMTPAPRYVE